MERQVAFFRVVDLYGVRDSRWVSVPRSFVSRTVFSVS